MIHRHEDGRPVLHPEWWDAKEGEYDIGKFPVGSLGVILYPEDYDFDGSECFDGAAAVLMDLHGIIEDTVETARKFPHLDASDVKDMILVGMGMFILDYACVRPKDHQWANIPRGDELKTLWSEYEAGRLPWIKP